MHQEMFQRNTAFTKNIRVPRPLAFVYQHYRRCLRQYGLATNVPAEQSEPRDLLISERIPPSSCRASGSFDRQILHGAEQSKIAAPTRGLHLFDMAVPWEAESSANRTFTGQVAWTRQLLPSKQFQDVF